MTVEQVALTLIVAIVTAFATSALNNWFELRRLQSMWKRETDERIASYRKQRLEQRLASIEGYVESVLRIIQPLDILSRMGKAEVMEKVRDTAWAVNTAYAVSRAVGDERLGTAIDGLDGLMGEARRKVLEDKVSSEDSEWRGVLDRILQVAGVAFKRVDELLVEVYAEGLPRR
ncbi:MAG: hypothetical protein MUP64_03115 [Anaerolineae bacterium]|nr:hypothetical protein [Anaerolineae bacterium]